MRLINVKSFHLREFLGAQSSLPNYAILSHTWHDDEVSFRDIADLTRAEKREGFKKIEYCCKQAAQDGLDWAWVDTCCIDKTSSAELSEAINSMYKWYEHAVVCYAYLSDVNSLEEFMTKIKLNNPSELPRWFYRGWTLQELLAPAKLIFYGASWTRIGEKDEICQALEQVTRIPGDILRRKVPLSSASVAARMSWASRRKTTREEDIAYCLLGIFGVNMPLLYGEGERAFVRLQEEILKEIEDDTLFTWMASEESALEAPYRGLFASSPAEFIYCAQMRPFGVLETGATTLLGQGRVSLSCTVDSMSGRDGTIRLRCFSTNLANALAIEVVKTGGNEWIRINPRRLRLGAPSVSKPDSVFIKKYARLKKNPLEDQDDIYRRDGIRISSLPHGVDLERTYPPRIAHPTDPKLIPVMNAIKEVATFVLSARKSVLGENARILLTLWVEPRIGSPFPGLDSRSYDYFYGVETIGGPKPLEGVDEELEDALKSLKRPETSVAKQSEAAVSVGWASLRFTGERRNVGSHDMLCFDVGLEIDEAKKCQI